MAVKKLSERTTDQAFEALLLMAEPASKIFQDGDVWKAIEGNLKGKSKITFAEVAANSASIFIGVVKVALKSHRDDIYSILSIMTEKTADEIKAQALAVTLSEISECKEDRQLMDFFTSFRRQTGTK